METELPWQFGHQELFGSLRPDRGLACGLPSPLVAPPALVDQSLQLLHLCELTQHLLQWTVLLGGSGILLSDLVPGLNKLQNYKT